MKWGPKWYTAAPCQEYLQQAGFFSVYKAVTRWRITIIPFFYPFELILLRKPFRPSVERYLSRGQLPDGIDWLDASWVPLTVLLLYFPRCFVHKGLWEVGKRTGQPLWGISVWNCFSFLKVVFSQLTVWMWVIRNVIHCSVLLLKEDIWS